MHSEFEARVHRVLRALPAPQAPPTLVPRVMRAVEGPVTAGWRAVGLAGAIAASVLLALGAPWMAAAAGWGSVVSQAAGLAAGVERTFRAMGLVWQLAEPVVVSLTVVVFVMGALAAGCGLALGRVVLRTEA